MPEIQFAQWDQTVRVPDGLTVARACEAAGHPLDLVCGGNGRCGKCLTEVEDGAGRRIVRACVTEVTEGMRIWRTEADGLRILEHGDAYVPAGDRACPEEARYAAACDLGTTSVVLYLYDRREGALLGRWSDLNAQSTLGSDVVARLQAALEPESGAALRRKAVETIGGLLARAAKDTGVPCGRFSALVVAGNSAMQHLLFGFPVARLARSPYVCHTEAPVRCAAAELGLEMAPGATVEFLPLIGSFVGGDTVAAMLAAGWETAEPVRLLIDLGTNGELVIGNRHRRLAASAAAGPAMEGAGIVHGMRGTAGAIEGVRISDRGLELRVIGEQKPAGLCGSGLVDLMAELTAHGVTSPQGRMASPEEFLERGGAPWLAERLLTVDGQRAFLVAEGGGTATGAPILFYQADVRAMQLSKGAIAAAAQLLLNAYGIEGCDLEEIQLAGAFGNYIDIVSAQRIGLIPDLPGVPVRPVGNAAGVGAQMYLLSEEKREAARTLAETTTHVELASMPEFTYTFAAGMELCPMSEMELDDL